MTYPTVHDHKTILEPSSRGSVLLIALLLLAAVALSTVYLSLVLLNEIKSTRYADNGYNAKYAAESGIERALWRVTYDENDSTMNPNPPYTYKTYGFMQLDNAKNLCASDDGGAEGQCLSRCSSDATTVDSTSPNFYVTCSQDSDCLPSWGGHCVAALPNSDAERTYNYNRVMLAGFSYDKYNVPYNTPAFLKVYDPTIAGTSNSTGVQQLNIYWYVDQCTPTESNAQLKVDYQPINIDDVVSAQPWHQDLLTPVGTPNPVIITCNCDTSAANQSMGVDSNGVTMYRCALKWDIGDLTVAHPGSPPTILNQTQIPATNYYRLKFTPLTPGVTVRKITVISSRQGNTYSDFVSNTSFMPSQIQIQAYGTYREAQSYATYLTSWQDAYGSSTSLFYHEN